MEQSTTCWMDKRKPLTIATLRRDARTRREKPQPQRSLSDHPRTHSTCSHVHSYRPCQKWSRSLHKVSTYVHVRVCVVMSRMALSNSSVNTKWAILVPSFKYASAGGGGSEFRLLGPFLIGMAIGFTGDCGTLLKFFDIESLLGGGGGGGACPTGGGSGAWLRLGGGGGTPGPLDGIRLTGGGGGGPCDGGRPNVGGGGGGFEVLPGARGGWLGPLVGGGGGPGVVLVGGLGACDLTDIFGALELCGGGNDSLVEEPAFRGGHDGGILFPGGGAGSGRPPDDGGCGRGRDWVGADTPGFPGGRGGSPPLRPGSGGGGTTPARPGGGGGGAPLLPGGGGGGPLRPGGGGPLLPGGGGGGPLLPGGGGPDPSLPGAVGSGLEGPWDWVLPGGGGGLKPGGLKAGPLAPDIIQRAITNFTENASSHTMFSGWVPLYDRWGAKCRKTQYLRSLYAHSWRHMAKGNWLLGKYCSC